MATITGPLSAAEVSLLESAVHYYGRQTRRWEIICAEHLPHRQPQVLATLWSEHTQRGSVLRPGRRGKGKKAVAPAAEEPSPDAQQGEEGGAPGLLPQFMLDYQQAQQAQHAEPAMLQQALAYLALPGAGPEDMEEQQQQQQEQEQPPQGRRARENEKQRGRRRRQRDAHQQRLAGEEGTGLRLGEERSPASACRKPILHGGAAAHPAPPTPAQGAGTPGCGRSS